MYVNVGAKDTRDGTNIPSKKALKTLIATTPANVTLYNTSGFNGQSGRTGDNLDIGVKYTVVGPNPYTNRKWYATVERTEKGVTVK